MTWDFFESTDSKPVESENSSMLTEDDLMPILLDNPFTPPLAELTRSSVMGRRASPNAEEIRKKYLRHESGVRSLGDLFYFGAILVASGAVFTLGFVAADSGTEDTPWKGPRANPTEIILFYGSLSAILGILGYGLRSLRSWARWIVFAPTLVAAMYSVFTLLLAALFIPLALFSRGTMTRLGIRELLILPIVLPVVLIPIYFSYLLVSRKGSVVFSADYKQVISRTPHINY